MAGQIGRSMRAAGVHQGLAPVLDVALDYRWGRTEETMGEDPYLVGTLGAAYVRGLEGAGVVATLKHFAGYSASRGGRNFGPVEMGPRHLADVLLPPFEMALRLGGARSVMNSYAEIDGVPVAADESLLTGLLRDEWGFAGTVVSDYFAIRFLHSLHGVAAGSAEAAGIALRAGIDVELPTMETFGAAMVEAVRHGAIDEALVDRALARVLTQKAELGLLDPAWRPEPDGIGQLRLDDETGQPELVRAVLAAGTPVVMVVLAGRPYALGEAETAAGIVYGFFSGQRGGQALAEVLTGAVNPSGRLPVSVPLRLTGAIREVGPERRLASKARI